MANDILRDCLRRTSEFVNLVNPALILSDTRLKELVTSAQQTILLEMANEGLANLRQEAVVTVPIGSTVLSSSGLGPPVVATPSMLAPIRLWERQVGTTIWIPMTKVIDHLPVNTVPGPTLGWWEWRDQAIRVIGVTAPVEVKIHFAPRTAGFQMPSDFFSFPDLVNPVAYSAASIALGGNDFYESRAAKDLGNIYSIDTHVQQSVPVRLRRRRGGVRRY